MGTMLKSSSMPSVSGSSLEEISGGVRRATAENSSSAARPDPEVAAVARRRRVRWIGPPISTICAQPPSAK
jgi:hypothetical protein